MPLTEPDLQISSIRLFSLTRLAPDNAGSFGVFVGKLKSGKSMNKFKKFAMITDYDLNIFDYQGIKHAKRDCKLSIGGDEDENGPCQARRSRVADCG
ncbi:MAG: hypothetical protein WCI51_08970 [Lentisphaerota bacterium]